MNVSGQLQAQTALPWRKSFPILIGWVGCMVCLDVAAEGNNIRARSGNRNTCRTVRIHGHCTALSYHSFISDAKWRMSRKWRVLFSTGRLVTEAHFEKSVLHRGTKCYRIKKRMEFWVQDIYHKTKIFNPPQFILTRTVLGSYNWPIVVVSCFNIPAEYSRAGIAQSV
jgi:hypothetical protein